MATNGVTSSTNVQTHRQVSDSHHCCHHSCSSSPSIFMDAGLGVRMVNPAYANYSSDMWISNNNAYWNQQQQMEYEMYQQQREDSFAAKGAAGGALAGAAVGTCIGGFPIGTVVGGLIGGIGGLFGGKLFSKW